MCTKFTYYDIILNNSNNTKIETMSDTVHYPFLKKLIDLGVVGVLMIDEQFVMLEAANLIDQNFQPLQSMVHLSVQSPSQNFLTMTF